MVRSLHYTNFRSPWPLIKKGRKGWRKIGPMIEEKRTWPSANREFPELNPKWYGVNPPELHNYTHVKPVGYVDPVTKKFVMVKEMVPEMVVPDLTNFPLKPYVSYRTDVEIEKRRTAYELLVEKKGSETAADLHSDIESRWPPPKMTAKTLFDLHYADKIREEYKKRNQD